jgi:CYTH domain-containing protein
MERAGKYAIWELERRFVFHELPDRFELESRWLVEDRYLLGTSLRLRAMERLDGDHAEVRLKLGQKHVDVHGDWSRMRSTNLYLVEEEHALLAGLPAHVLRKERRIGTVDGERFAIDLIELGEEQLRLATIDFEDDASMAGWSPPGWLDADVSSDERYTGAALAAAGELP